MEDRTRVHVFVSGTVQGVGFRQAVLDKANELDVTGWVKNLPDGRIEAVLEGPRDDVYRVVGLCRAGPQGAQVSGVQVDREPPKNEKTFRLK
ncbi:acylphosphatase [soil metagenome]|nr:acylphosphatase [Actinomycetota bacterium]MDQ3531020.1 acylphosphatase [Actinomycetota bacterium]